MMLLRSPTTTSQWTNRAVRQWSNITETRIWDNAFEHLLFDNLIVSIQVKSIVPVDPSGNEPVRRNLRKPGSFSSTYDIINFVTVIERPTSETNWNANEIVASAFSTV